MVKVEFVACVRCLISEDAARRDNSQWRIMLLHVSNLHRTRVCPQKMPRIFWFEPKRVPHIAGWVIGRNVERVKIVPFGFNFRTLGYGKSHRLKNLFRFRLRERERVRVPFGKPLTWGSNIDMLADGEFFLDYDFFALNFLFSFSKAFFK